MSATEPAPKDDVSRQGVVGRFLLWSAGTDPELLSSRVERYRAVGVGVFVLLVAIMGAIAFGLYASTVWGGFNLWFIPFAIFWATLVFFIDRSIVVDPHYGNLDKVEDQATRDIGRASITSPWPPPSLLIDVGGIPGDGANGNGHLSHELGATRRSRLRGSVPLRPFVYLLRVGMALVIAVLISEAIVLVIFRPEIAAEISSANDLEFQSAIMEMAASQAQAVQTQIDDLKTKITNNDSGVDQKRQKMDEARASYNGEVSGTSGTRQPGPGAETSNEWANYINARDLYNSAAADRDKSNADLREQISSLVAQQADLRAPGTAAIDNVKASSAGRQAYDETHQSPGWLAQEKAFQQFQQKNRDDFAVTVIPWLIRGLFVLIDILPLSFKLLNSAVVYGRRVRDEGQLARYRDRNNHLAELSKLNHQADLFIYQIGMTTFLDYERNSHYVATRADHLRAARPAGEASHGHIRDGGHP